MNPEQLKAYAIAGVTSRIAVLEEELSELRGVLARLQPTADAPLRTDSPRPASAAPRPRAVRALPTQAAAPVEVATPSAAEAPEPARILARRGRLPRPSPPADAQAVLPPMPRLVKASAN